MLLFVLEVLTLIILPLKATKALLKIASQVKNIYIVLGGAYSHTKKFMTLAQKNIKIYQNLIRGRTIQKLWLTSNFAIAPASTILYELCCVKMPILSGFYVDNQENIYNGFVEKKAIFGMGNMKNFDVASFQKNLELFFKSDFQELITSQKKIFDKNIKERYHKLIFSLC